MNLTGTTSGFEEEFFGFDEKFLNLMRKLVNFTENFWI